MGIQKRNLKIISVCFALVVFSFMMSISDKVVAKEGEKIVFVSLFSNLSKYKSSVTYETGPKNDLDFKNKSVTVDRYSEIPRSMLEDEIANMGVKVVERQNLTKLLEENQFTLKSGLVDSSTALKVGKMVGANTLVNGTILNISTKTKNYTGYGIKTQTNQIICNLRVHVVDINTGGILFTKMVKGVSTNVKTDNAEEIDSDEAASSIENAVQEIVKDGEFKKFLL